MSISFYNEDVDLPDLDFMKIDKWLKSVLSSYKKRLGAITYIFCSDKYLLDINIKFLDHNYLTDIITFDYVEGPVISGDLFLSVDRIRENARQFSSGEQDEFLRVIVHGLLHLLSFNDHTEEERNEMRALEDKMIMKYTNY